MAIQRGSDPQHFDQPDPLNPESSGGRRSGRADAITALFILLTVGVIAYVLLLVADPHSALNPLPPPTPLSIMVIATDIPTNTPTQTPTPLPATYTPTASDTPIPTSTGTATFTSTPLPTAVFNIPTKAGSPAPVTSPTVSTSAYFKAATIAYQANQTSSGCQWSSVAGVVLDKAGKPLPGIAVRITGSGGTINEVHYSGQIATFGPAGFEAYLGTQPRADNYTVQLLSATGSPLSDAVPVQTKTGCTQNVTFITFQQAR